MDVTILKTLLALLIIGAHIRHTAIAQAQTEKEYFLLHPVEDAPGFPPIYLAFLAHVELEREENVPLGLLSLGQIATHRAETAGKSILIAQPLIDPRAGMTLFARLLPIGFYPGINNGEE